MIIENPEDLTDLNENLDETFIYNYSDTDFETEADEPQDPPVDRLNRRSRRRPAYLASYVE